MSIDRLPSTDSAGRRYWIYICDHGHWHRGLGQAQRCQSKHRRIERERELRANEAVVEQAMNDEGVPEQDRPQRRRELRRELRSSS